MARILLEGGDRLATETGDLLVLESHVGSGVLDSDLARDTFLCVILDVEFDDGTLYVWSGVGTLLFQNHEYQGLGSLIGFTANENSTGAPSHKITVELNAEHPAVRGRFLQPLGNLEVDMKWIKSSDEGRTWTALPIGKKGYTSNLRLQSGRVLIDLVHPFEIAFRRRPRYWSNEDARRRNSRDSGFAMQRDIAGGVNIRFPFLKHSTKDK